jgi:predicted ABC-type ATPase
MAQPQPKVVVLAGPNGAGKSTAARQVLRGVLDVPHFVNADSIAKGLSEFEPERAAFQAGRIMLTRMRELSGSRSDFAFETTLATRSYAPWLLLLQQEGYRVLLVFLWLPTVELAIARVAERVSNGGHNIPEPTIRRRYRGGLINFHTLYLPLADDWWFVDNTFVGRPQLIAQGVRNGPPDIYLPTEWLAAKWTL